MRSARIFLLLLTLVSFGALMPESRADDMVVPKFTDETQSSGFDFTFTGEWQYMVGGGVATFDCNGDGYPDMFTAGGTSPAALFVNKSTQGGPLKFARQTGTGLELGDTVGAYPIDVDGDGITDLVVLRVGESVVMRGLGDCKFARANEAWNFSGGDEWWTAFAATWERGNTWPTLALGAYVDRTQDIEPWGTCTDNWLERPATGGKGFDKPIALKPSYCALSMLFTDWNRSGTPSLRIANDREYYEGGQEQMWKIDPGQPPVPYTAADGWQVLKIWGMGIASADLTGDGYPDYFITSMADNKLQTLASVSAGGGMKPQYKDVAYARGAIAQHPYVGGDYRPSTAWHTQFEDVNNDGRLDLFIAKGNVDKMPDFAAADPNDLLLQQPDGKFIEVGDKAGVDSTAVSRGGALPDFNLDGLVDLVVVNRNSPAQIWRNTTPNPANWIEIQLSQPGPNRDAVGAHLEVKVGDIVNTREITIGGGHVSGQLGFWHFGLAAADSAMVRVTWPDGTVGDWVPLAANGFYVLDRTGGAKTWTPAHP